MNIIEIIDKKRRGLTHSHEEIATLVGMMESGKAHDYQISAWLMAVCIQGLNMDETTWLTQAFVDSGKKIDLSEAGGVVVDKHSTGGVGDKTTLALIPMLASAGVKVAKLSGRGLGFTGGTIDKLEAIPGFKTSLSGIEFVEQIQKLGMAISSQTADLAPADGKMYALRDVTATVASIPLIAASVISKKIAAGADVIVLDIKYGSGAFMGTLEDAKDLAFTCREVGKRLGKSISTVISAMNQPLGYAIGHSLEVIEIVNLLKGQGPQDLEDLCVRLGGVALIGAGRFDSLEEAESTLRAELHDGTALAKFKALIQAQRGDVGILDDFSLLPQPDRVLMVPSPQSGYIAEIDALEVAKSAKLVGAGRLTKDCPINLGVGVVLRKKVGDAVKEGETLVELHAGDKDHWEALEVLKKAFHFSPQPVTLPPLIEEVLVGDVWQKPSVQV
ncbi:thymidine phosphorylase [Vampirovibrio chlorellavorus]|uniref:thymidine phosphorylase n=1 Tax=Vampirovibrio chlorellavorus TaxID=758823 RepID=UPI0026ECF6BD|nr:thymidine phosphorylase [Vampirovibrio chlorellavorus]